MAWTDPSSINFNTGQVITETKLEQVTDNLLALVRSGDSTGLAPTTTAAEITSTASEMSMRTATAAGNTTGWLIPAGLIGTNRMIKLIALGDFVWNASITQRWRIYLRDGAGANTLLFDDTQAAPNLGAARQAWWLDLMLVGLGSASSQLLTGTLFANNGNTTAPTSGIGNIDAPGIGGHQHSTFADDAASAVDMSAARYLDITITPSASSASLAWRLKYATLQVF